MSDLVDRARAAADASDADLPALGLARLTGGMTHAVFAPVEEPSVVVKVFATTAREEPEREWDGLVALAGSGLAPEPVHLDTGETSVVVMSRIAGASQPAGELDEGHAVAIGRAHRRVHSVAPPTRRPMSHSWVRNACERLRNDGDPATHDGASDVFTEAWAAAAAWVRHGDVERILSAGTTSCFSRGDPNLGNYLWSGDGVVLVDWEDSGDNDPVLELADFAEHASTRALTDDFWNVLADATELRDADRRRIPDARRLMASFWLVLIADRQRQGRPTTVTLEQQASRTLARFD